MQPRLLVLVAALVLFGAYTLWVVAVDGYTGFISLALAEPWGGQLFVDLVIALVLFLTWMRRDAPAHGIPTGPYLALVLTTGSIGALAYLIHRELRSAGSEAAGSAA